MDRGRAQDFAVAQQPELGGAAAHIYVQEGLAALMGQRHGAGAMGGQNAFQIVAGGGAHEFSARAGEQLRDGTRVFSLQRGAGQDHRAGINLVWGETSLRVSGVYKAFQRVDVDQPIFAIRRKQNRRSVQDLAVHHHEPTGQRLREPLQVQFRKQQMRS